MSSTTSPRESFTDEERLAVSAQLDRLLANPFFSHSRRFPSFLRYVVEQTLAGNAEHLKERTLGVEIFGKDASYDTANDPIVRVTAAEIRKRIAQYYQQPGHESELRLSLPPGSYVPHFFGAGEAPAANSAPALAVSPVADRLPPVVREPELSARPLAPLPPERPHAHPRWRVAFLALLTLLLAVMAVAAWHQHKRSAFNEFWAPVLSSGDPVLFCVADQTQYTAIALRDAADPSHQVILKDNLTAVIIDDLDTITKLAAVLQSSGARYTLRGESSTTLADLRSGPSVMIGAFDNAWTLRMLRPLRFHFSNNPQMTSFNIVDAAAANHVRWRVDRTQQIATNNYQDYAIVARFTDATTGMPTLIAAGIGRGGTIAAGEFLTSPELLQDVWRQRTAGAKNVEVVLSTQIIGGEPGTPRIEAVYFW